MTNILKDERIMKYGVTQHITPPIDRESESDVESPRRSSLTFLSLLCYPGDTVLTIGDNVTRGTREDRKWILYTSCDSLPNHSYNSYVSAIFNYIGRESYYMFKIIINCLDLLASTVSTSSFFC